MDPVVRRSQYVHLIPLGGNRDLCVHATTGVRLVLSAEVTAILKFFARPRRLMQATRALSAKLGHAPSAVEDCLKELMSREFLTSDSRDEEVRRAVSRFSDTYGRHPRELLDRFRQHHAEGPHDYWATGAPRGLSEFRASGTTLRVVFLGACDVQMEADFLRIEGGRRGIDVRVAATFLDDLASLRDMPHDAVIVGALPSRESVADKNRRGADCLGEFLAEARSTVERVRDLTKAPIIVNNLPIPTVQPLGFADRGLDGHRNRFRAANRALESLVAEYPGAYLADVDEALSAHGKSRLLDDSLVSFTHFGSLGWMLQRPEAERAAVHGVFPNVGPLADIVGGDPYGFEALLSATHLDLLITIFALDQKKCVIVDLDGILWPGGIAETGSPFNWSPEVSGAFSFVGLYFGVHEALKALKQRGIVLACASKNDEATVRALWRYEGPYPMERLLSLDDFATHRINWNDKIANIASMAQELGFALETVVVLDDSPMERDRIKRFLPEVLVAGEDLLGLRRWLLSDPRFQPAVVTTESSSRAGAVKGRLQGRRALPTAQEDAEFRESLRLEWNVAEVRDEGQLSRVKELFDRTTQFNTAGQKYQLAELAAICRSNDSAVFVIHLRDRFGDQGIVGAAIVEAGVIVGFCFSCRALGLDLEHRFLERVLGLVAPSFGEISARLVPTARNLPARNLYKDHGFAAGTDGLWRRSPPTGASAAEGGVRRDDAS